MKLPGSLFALIALSACGFGQTPQVKIGLINIPGAILGTRDGRAAQAQLEGQFLPRKTKLDEAQQEIAQLRERLKGTALLGERQQILQTLNQKSAEFRRDDQNFRADVDTELKKILNSLSKKMLEVVRRYAKEKGFALVLDSSVEIALVYADATDITAAVSEAYDGGGR